MAGRPREESTSDDDSAAPGDGDNGTRERRGGRRRTYNRRLDDKEVSPPYFETFDRIAKALEGIEELLRSRSVVLPDADVRERIDSP